jgi:2-aminoethylphosphonate-pyruvate transaminase
MSATPGKLLNPGPVTLTSRVRQSLLQEDLCHREPEFSALQSEIRSRLAAVYPEAVRAFTAALLTGSGTAAVEAMVGSLVPRNGHALVVTNGVYGERMAAILRAQGKAHDVASTGWSKAMDLDAVQRRLAETPRISHVLAVHHETTTGRLNDLPALGAICRGHGVPLLLDAVSSFGGEEIEFEAWNLEACAATANKCLHGVPGISFVLARRSAFEKGVSGATSLYLDLFRHHEEQEKGSAPFTQAVHACYALVEALRELEDSGGWRARHAHYRALSKQVFEGLQKHGVAPLLEIEKPSSVVLTAYRLPPGHLYRELHDSLKACGFVIYAGQGGLGEEIFRIAVMGDLGRKDIDALLLACARHWRREEVLGPRVSGVSSSA